MLNETKPSTNNSDNKAEPVEVKKHSDAQRFNALFKFARMFSYRQLVCDPKTTLVLDIFDTSAQIKLTYIPWAIWSTSGSGSVKPMGKNNIPKPPTDCEELREQLDKQIKDILIWGLKHQTDNELLLHLKAHQTEFVQTVKEALQPTWIPAAEKALKGFKDYTNMLEQDHKSELERLKLERSIRWPHSVDIKVLIEQAGFSFSPTTYKRDRCECYTCRAEYTEYTGDYNWQDILSYHKGNCPVPNQIKERAALADLAKLSTELCAKQGAESINILCNVIKNCLAQSVAPSASTLASSVSRALNPQPSNGQVAVSATEQAAPSVPMQLGQR